MKRKSLDINKIILEGWLPKENISSGIKKTYELCLETHGFCDQVRTDYINCLEKAYLLYKS